MVEKSGAGQCDHSNRIPRHSRYLGNTIISNTSYQGRNRFPNRANDMKPEYRKGADARKNFETTMTKLLRAPKPDAVSSLAFSFPATTH